MSVSILPPLHRAVIQHDARKLKQRLALGDDVNMRVQASPTTPGTTCTALYMATRNGDKVIMKILLESGADVSLVSEPDGRSVLHAAFLSGDIEVAELLLDAGANIDNVNKEGYGALHIASMVIDMQMLELLLSSGAAVDLADRAGNTPLMSAVRHGSKECVSLLLAAGADPSTSNNAGITALHYASQTGGENLGAMRDVVKRGRSESEELPLPEHARVVEMLVEAGADPNSELPQKNETPLMLASDVAVVKALLKSGASVTPTDTDGNGVLHHAAAHGYSSPVICTQYKFGANPTALNKAGLTPAEVARGRGHDGAAQLLEMLATKYNEKEAFVTNEQRCADTASAGVEVVAKIKAVTVSDRESGEDSKMSAVEAKVDQFDEEVNYSSAATVANEQRSAELLCAGTADVELTDKMSALYSSQIVEEVKMPAAAGLETEPFGEKAEQSSQSTQVNKEEKQHKVLQPCLHCHTLTHRRCARCRTAYICSRDCQMATMAEHKPICMQIYEERERSKAERKAKRKEEEA